ncbi:MAG: FtsX-like permease family protein [Planctomycetes bacterium]|nr:FtsX-like permease family protein [Planctomycetota bacterium]
MNLLTAFRIALNALVMHKGRSALTSLGIIIGTGAVISMVSAAGGARAKLDERLDNVGKTLIVIRAGARTQNGTLADIKPLTNEEATVLRKQLRLSTMGIAEVQATVRVAATRTRNCVTMVVGTSPDMKTVRNWVMQHGRFLTEDDLKKQAAICVIGQTVREKLFPDTPDPVGQVIRIDRLQLRVVGVTEPKGRSPIGGDQDDQIFLPLNTLQRKLVGDEALSMLLTSVDSVEKLDKCKEDITRILREKRRGRAGMEDFDVSSVQEMAEIAVVMTRTMQFLIGIIASISLVVGGIGIMNIMLVSVTERTREIGIRMAIGATPADILTQFLIEAILLSLLGGVIGITLGILAAVALARAANWPIFIDYSMVALSFAVSGGVGVFFGYYPALKASRLDPIDALRYE